MPATYEPIATTTLSSAASTITFSSIPSTYTDLRLVLVGVSTGSFARLTIRINGDTGTNYSQTNLFGDGSSATSNRYTSNDSITSTAAISGSDRSLFEVDFLSYAGSTNKTCLYTASGDKNGSGRVERIVALWRNTAAINQLSLIEGSGGSWSIGTTATLYGIKSA